MATFKTLKKSNVVIVQQPITYLEKFTSGANIGKVKRKRMIQYCAELETIFVDEQRKIVDNPMPTPIYLNKGHLKVDDDNITMMELMECHPHNEANGGNLFKLLDIDTEEVLELAHYKTTFEAVNAVLTASDNEVRAVAVWFLGQSFLDKSISKIKIVLKQRIESDIKIAQDVSSFLLDKNNEEKLLVTLALDEEIIKIVEGKKVEYNGEVIYISAQAHDVIKDFAVWLKSDEEGRIFLKALASKLKSK